jgi:hypothetical protein
MQTPDQSSEKNQSSVDHSAEAAEVTDPIQATYSSSNDLPDQLESQKSDSKAAEDEAIRRGLIYPPPPDFYEQLPLPVALPNELKPASVYMDNVPRTTYTPQDQRLQEQQPRVGYPAYPQGQDYTGTQPPPFVAGPLPAKKSRKWTMITLSVLAALILISCGLCAWASAPLFGKIYAQTYNVEVNGLQAVNDYYAALQNKQYAQAYGDISTQGSLKNLSQAAFIAQAQKQDSLYGPVLRYTPGQPEINNYSGEALTTFPITVDIARNKQSYKAHLQLTEINNQWKITSFDRL